MSTYDGPSLVEQMAKHSTALWVCLGDERGPTRLVPIYEPVSYRELVVRGFMIPTITITTDGQWTYTPSRAEGEWRADLDLGRRRGAHGMKEYPKPLGEFSPRRRLILEESQIHAMFGQVAA